jgi:hypothetical protein
VVVTVVVRKGAGPVRMLTTVTVMVIVHSAATAGWLVSRSVM